MSDSLTSADLTDGKVVNLVSTALTQTRLSGLWEMLKIIGESVEAYACLLWQVAPDSKLEAEPPEGHLFVLGEWVEDQSLYVPHDLPLRSVTGKAIVSNQVQTVEDVTTHPLVVRKKAGFLERADARARCSVPIAFLDGARGAVNLYRTQAVPFSEREKERVAQLASILPSLYEALTDRVSVNLIQTIDALLHRAELDLSCEQPPTTDVNEVLHSVCRAVSDAFGCLETSIFLEDQLEAAGRYELVATTWPGKIKKDTYRRSAADGATGWVLSRAKPVKIFDLIQFDRDKEAIGRDYPGLVWKDRFRIQSEIRALLDMSYEAELPPISYIASPVLAGSRTLGVIRCCTASEGRLANAELELLRTIAAQISRYWNNSITRREIQEENRCWRSLIESVSTLNGFVYKELNRETPDERRIFAEALRVTSSVIEGAEIMDVRLLDENNKALYYAETRGSAWADGSMEEIKKRRMRQFSLAEGSAGALVFRTGKPYMIRNCANDPYYSGTFSNIIKRMIVAPISVEDKIFGVLDVRGTKARDFPRNAEAIAELLGKQLGLYHHLAAAIGELRKTQADLKYQIEHRERSGQEQARAFEDLEHQSKSPILQAYIRVQAVLSEAAAGTKIRSELQAISGLVSKAKRVAMSTGVFSRLASGERIEPNIRILQHDHLVRMLIQAAADNEVMIDPARHITFHVDRRPDVLRYHRVEVDLDLLEQAVNNVLDNAGRYSFNNTRVEITWGLTGSDRFHINVINRGLPVRADEIKRCFERGWRSGLAEATTGEGSGIGLWIVYNIMRIHGGEIILVPTTQSGTTEVKLVFPTSQLVMP